MDGKPKQYLLAVPEGERLDLMTVEQHHLRCITDKPPAAAVWFGHHSQKAEWVSFCIGMSWYVWFVSSTECGTD